MSFILSDVQLGDYSVSRQYLTMRKTDKKIDNQLRIGLTDVCEIALKQINGFQWLTHTVNYTHFPQSLTFVCVFQSNEQLLVFKASDAEKLLINLIEKKLNDIGVKLKRVANHILYDSEENCAKVDQGNWAKRLSNLKTLQ